MYTKSLQIVIPRHFGATTLCFVLRRFFWVRYLQFLKIHNLGAGGSAGIRQHALFNMILLQNLYHMDPNVSSPSVTWRLLEMPYVALKPAHFPLRSTRTAWVGNNPWKSWGTNRTTFMEPQVELMPWLTEIQGLYPFHNSW